MMKNSPFVGYFGDVYFPPILQFQNSFGFRLFIKIRTFWSKFQPKRKINIFKKSKSKKIFGKHGTKVGNVLMTQLRVNRSHLNSHVFNIGLNLPQLCDIRRLPLIRFYIFCKIPLQYKF